MTEAIGSAACGQFCAEAALVRGAVGTGKTSRLADAAAGFVRQGEGASTLVVCASPLAAETFRTFLRKCDVEPCACGIRVLTARDVALEILAAPEARALTGRDGRLASFDDEEFLLEDLKTSGMREGRIREMVKFFRKSWTELADDDPAWLVTSDEVQIHTLLEDCLAAARFVLEPEAANLARRVLLANPGMCERFGADHVLVDDYQMLSRASQCLCEMLARHSITVAADPAACVEVHDSYPYGAGVMEFAETHPQVQVEELQTCVCCSAPHAAALRLAHAEGLEVPVGEERSQGDDTMREGAFECRVFDTPKDEFAGIAAYVGEAMARGVDAADIVVAVPNGVWEKNVSGALRDAGLPACGTACARAMHGNVREPAGDECVRALCALRLAANPQDAAAWRAWCGYGDYLTNSPTFIDLRGRMRATGEALKEALAHLSEHGRSDGAPLTSNDNAVIRAYRIAGSFLATSRSLEGPALVQAAAQCACKAAGSADVDAVAGQVMKACGLEPQRAQGLGAAEMLARARGMGTVGMPARAQGMGATGMSAGTQGLGEGRSPEVAQGVVRVLPYREALGASPEVLVVAGFVNGFIPRASWFDLTKTSHEHRARRRVQDAALLYALMGKAANALLVTSFGGIDLVSATKLKLKIDRIHLQNGERVCAISPSMFLDELK